MRCCGPRASAVRCYPSSLIAGFIPIVAVPLLWLLYWWLSTIGAEFLWYQWDALLLETGALAMLVAPLVWRERASDPHEPPRVAVWLMWWLRVPVDVRVGRGQARERGPDVARPDRHDLSLRNAADSESPRVLRTSSAGRVQQSIDRDDAGDRARRAAPDRWSSSSALVAAVLLVGLQLLIAVTGNFAFFNLLSIALCVWLVDDAAWQYVASAFRRTSAIAAAWTSALKADATYVKRCRSPPRS